MQMAKNTGIRTGSYNLGHLHTNQEQKYTKTQSPTSTDSRYKGLASNLGIDLPDPPPEETTTDTEMKHLFGNKFITSENTSAN